MRVKNDFISVKQEYFLTALNLAIHVETTLPFIFIILVFLLRKRLRNIKHYITQFHMPLITRKYDASNIPDVSNKLLI